MAKAKYNPLNAIKDDPLAGLKQATTERASAIAYPARSIEADSSGNKEGEMNSQSKREGKISGSPAPRTESGRALSSAPVKPLSATLKPSRNTVYLYPEDLTKLRQLSGYASTEHGVRANDSMIVRAALSLIDMDVRFLHALKEAELFDRRRTARSG